MFTCGSRLIRRWCSGRVNGRSEETIEGKLFVCLAMAWRCRSGTCGDLRATEDVDDALTRRQSSQSATPVNRSSWVPTAASTLRRSTSLIWTRTTSGSVSQSLSTADLFFPQKPSQAQTYAEDCVLFLDVCRNRSRTNLYLKIRLVWIRISEPWKVLDPEPDLSDLRHISG